MDVRIKILCEDERELLLHLTVIREQIRKSFKKNPYFKGRLKDSNCYGDHVVKIDSD